MSRIEGTMTDYPPHMWDHKHLVQEYDRSQRQIAALRHEIENLNKVIIQLREDPRVPNV